MQVQPRAEPLLVDVEEPTEPGHEGEQNDRRRVRHPDTLGLGAFAVVEPDAVEEQVAIGQITDQGSGVLQRESLVLADVGLSGDAASADDQRVAPRLGTTATPC